MSFIAQKSAKRNLVRESKRDNFNLNQKLKFNFYLFSARKASDNKKCRIPYQNRSQLCGTWKGGMLSGGDRSNSLR